MKSLYALTNDMRDTLINQGLIYLGEAEIVVDEEKVIAYKFMFRMSPTTQMYCDMKDCIVLDDDIMFF